MPTPLWHPSPPHHFLHAVVNMLTTNVLPTDPNPSEPLSENRPLPPAVVWRLKFTPRRGCELYPIGQIGLEGGRWGGVLPEEYVRWRMSR